MIESADLCGQSSADSQPLELGPKTRTANVFRVMFEGDRSRRFSMNDSLATVRYIFFQSVQRGLDQILLAGLVRFFVQMSPIVKVCVGTGNDQRSPLPFRSRVGIVKRKRAAGNISAQQQIGLKPICRTAEQQVARVAWDGIILAHRHVNLSAAVVQADLSCLLDKRLVKFIFASKIENRTT